MSRKRIKIAHEAPISLFDMVQELTHYDYCLVHLYDENEAYRDKFLEAKKKGREIILDTSVFELGTAFNEDKYIKVIEQLQPTWYIVPDVLEEAHATVQAAKRWISIHGTQIGESKPIGVVQGKDFREIQGCYESLDKDLSIPKIAFSFDYSYYEKTYYHPNKYVSWMLGRVGLLGQLVSQEVINVNKPHHLLGVALPIEGKFHGRYSWIESVDTSNPVVHGMKGFEYQSNIGLYSKESEKLFKMINYELRDADKIDRQTIEKLIEHNLKEFNKYWNFETF
jgi:hypothetical protein